MSREYRVRFTVTADVTAGSPREAVFKAAQETGYKPSQASSVDALIPQPPFLEHRIDSEEWEGFSEEEDERKEHIDAWS